MTGQGARSALDALQAQDLPRICDCAKVCAACKDAELTAGEWEFPVSLPPGLPPGTVVHINPRPGA